MNITVLKNEIDYTSSSILLTFESVYAKTSLRKAGKQQMSFTMIFGYIHTFTAQLCLFRILHTP